MNTPIWDFVKKYAENEPKRMHMPGHKGVLGPLGVEKFDITEVQGADSLYEASGIIKESEENASSLFESQSTLYSTEGSTQCIKAMLYLAVTYRRAGSFPLVLAMRNSHLAFLYAAASIGFDVRWIPPGSTPMGDIPMGYTLARNTSGPLKSSLDVGHGYGYLVNPEVLEKILESLKDTPPAAVYLTSPDYLGKLQQIKALSEVCSRYLVPLLVDNAHGAYLKFTGNDHPLDQGADMCCDSAHKTLPVLTGGAYLHISKKAPASFSEKAKAAMALFGSTSPSYLILSSLDICNKILSEDFKSKLLHTISLCDKLRISLRDRGFKVLESDPLRITILSDELGGEELGKRLKCAHIEPEYVWKNGVVLMVSPYNSENFPELIIKALEESNVRTDTVFSADLDLDSYSSSSWPQSVISIREALFSQSENLPVKYAYGRVAAFSPLKSPPGIPLVMPGEMIDKSIVKLLLHFGVKNIDVVC